METLQDSIETFAFQTQMEWHPEYGIYTSESYGKLGATEWIYIFIAIMLFYIVGATIISSIKKKENDIHIYRIHKR